MQYATRGTQAIRDNVVEVSTGMGLPEVRIWETTLSTRLVIHIRTTGCSNASYGERYKKKRVVVPTVRRW